MRNAISRVQRSARGIDGLNLRARQPQAAKRAAAAARTESLLKSPIIFGFRASDCCAILCCFVTWCGYELGAPGGPGGSMFTPLTLPSQAHWVEATRRRMDRKRLATVSRGPGSAVALALGRVLGSA